MNEGSKAVTHRAKRDKTSEGKEGMKTKTPKVIWKQLTIRVPVEVHRALKVRAAEEGRSLAVIIEGLVREYLVGGKKA
jgi:predicted HicB family RNase H-like nuclease